MLNKKYYTIKDVAEILNISFHQLRYLEKIIPNFVIKTIKGRRYYTLENLEYLKRYYNKSKNSDIKLETVNGESEHWRIIAAIDDLIKNFQASALKLQDI